MKKLIACTLLLLSTIVGAETIDLSCASRIQNIAGESKYRDIDFNVKIVADPNSKAKIYLGDKDQDSVSEYGTSRVANFSINNSQIKFDIEFNSPPMIINNKVVSDAGESTMTYTISRATGKISIFTIATGGLKEWVKNGKGSAFEEGSCAKRMVNKF